MDSLPIEILTHILIHLPPAERIRLERVSKSWRKASRHTWASTKKLDIRVDYEEKRREVDRSKNVMYCENGTLVIHTDNPRVFYNITIHIKQYITWINLELPESRNSEKILMIIAQHFHKIEVLVYQTEFFNSDIFSRIIKGNEQLHSLKCLSWEGNLQTLPIRNWRSLHFQPIINNVKMWENVIIPMVNDSRSLQDFKILELWSSKVMEALLKQKYLKSLSIKSIDQPELPNYILEIPRLKNLETLRLVALENIGNDVIVDLLKGLSQNCRSLQELQILCDRMSIEALDVIATLPQLITLNLEFGSLTNDHLIRLTCCKHLAIFLNYPYDELITYTDDGLIRMIENAEELKTLDISDLEVSPKMFEKLLFKTENRQTSIEIKVSQDIFDELTVICRNSRIRIIEDMIPTDNVWNKMNNLKAFEKNIESTLRVMRKNDDLESWMTRTRSDQVSKNSEKSESFRQLGNRQYLKCDGSYINSAIESFTKSIAYAPLGSTELSLAYANRSALLMKVRLYDDALVDIRRALKTGYPDRLKAKLFLRRALCLKAAHPTAESDIEKTLENARGWLRRMDKKTPSRQIVTNALDYFNKMASLPPPHIKWNARRFLNNVFEENPEIIDASSSIAIKPMDNNKFGIVATRDIKPGEIISTQEPYTALLHEDRRYTNCWHCLSQTLSAIPCNSCVHVIFCSEACRDAAWSEYYGFECHIFKVDVLVALETAYIAAGMRLMIRAVKEARSVQGLKEIIQRIESDPDLRRKGIPDSKFDGTKLSSIYGLPTYDPTRTPDDYKKLTFLGLKFTLSLATQSNFFGEKMSVERFYRHKSVPFATAMLMIFFLIALRNLEQGYDARDSLTTMNPSLMIVPLHSHLAHNCAPNVSRCIIGSKVVVYAHYPIKQGEQIFLYKKLPLRRNSKKDLSVHRQADIIQPFECSSGYVTCTENWPNIHLPQCNVSLITGDLPLAHKVLLETIDERLKLSKRAHSAVIAKFINDLSVINSDWWNSELRRSRGFAQAVTLLNRIFFMLDNHREFF